MAETITGSIADSIIHNTITLDRFAEGTKNKIVTILTSAQNEIAGSIAAIDPAAPALTKWREERYKKLNQKISEILDTSYSDIKKESKADLKGMINPVAGKMVSDFNAAIGVNIFDVALTPELLGSIVNNTMINGKIIGDWWDKQNQDTKDKLQAQMNLARQQIEVGLVKGDSIGELVGRIRGTKLTPGVLSVSKREAEVLVRTSVHQVAQSARMEIYKQNEDILDGYEVIATLDKRTTPLCRGLDRKRYTLDFKPIGHSYSYPVGGPPFHWNCRSTLIPITKSYRELAEGTSLSKKKKDLLAEVPIGLRASMGGPVPGRMDYNEWLKTQPESVQKDVLGITRQQLWKDNKLTMADLIHQNGRQLTLAELKALIGDGTAITERKEILFDQMKSRAMQLMSQDDFQIYLDTMPEGQEALSVLTEKGYTPESLFKEVKTTESPVQFTWKMITSSGGAIDSFKQFNVWEVSCPEDNLARLNVVGQDYTRLVNQFPNLKLLLDKTAIEAFEFLDQPFIMLKGEKCIGEYSFFNKNIRLATKGISTKETKITKGGFSSGNNLTVVARHELGHHVMHIIDSEQRKAWIDLCNSHDKKWLSKNITKYAETNSKEAFAESFAIFTHPQYQPGFLQSDIETYFTKLLTGTDDFKAWKLVQDESLFAKGEIETLAGGQIKVTFGGKQYYDLSIPAEKAQFEKIQNAYLQKWKTSMVQGAEPVYSQKVAFDMLAAEQQELWLAKVENAKLKSGAIQAEAATKKLTDEFVNLASSQEASAMFQAHPEWQADINAMSFSENKVSLLKTDLEAWKAAEQKAQEAMEILANTPEYGKFLHSPAWNEETAKDFISAIQTSKQKGLEWAQNKLKTWEAEQAKNLVTLGGQKTYNLSIPAEKAQYEKIKSAYLQKYKASIVTGAKPTPAQQTVFDTLVGEEKELWTLKIEKAMGKVGEVTPPKIVAATAKQETKVEKAIETLLGKQKAGLIEVVPADLDTVIGKVMSKPEVDEWWQTFTIKEKKQFVDLPVEKQWAALTENGFTKEYKLMGKAEKVTKKEVLSEVAEDLAKQKIQYLIDNGWTTGFDTAEDIKNYYQSSYQNAFGEELLSLKNMTLSQKYDEIVSVLDDIGKVAPEKSVFVSPPPSPSKSALKFDDMVKYGEQQGSNRGGFYYHKDNPAERYYIKIPSNPEVARNEVLASKLYQIAGVDCPELQFIDVGGDTGIASRIMDGVGKLDIEAFKKGLVSGVGDGFAVDAWLGDWDVVGLGFDNLLQQGNRAIRIDVGGSLRFRAQGGMKGSAFGREVTELQSMRDGRSNSQAAAVFKYVKKGDLENGVRKVLSISDNQIRDLVKEYGPFNKKEADDLAEILIARKNDLAKKFPDIKVAELTKQAPLDPLKPIASVEQERIVASRANGYSLGFDKEDIEDHNVLFWTEQDKSGQMRTLSTMKIRGDAAAKLDEIVATTAETPQNIATGEVYSSTLTALKGAFKQLKAGEGIRAQDISRAKNAVLGYNKAESKLEMLVSRGEIAQSSLDAFRKHYSPWMDFLETVSSSSVGKKLVIPGNISSKMLKLFEEIPTIAKEGTKEPGLKLSKKTGAFEKKSIKKGRVTAEGRTVQTFEHYYETELDGVRVRYWPNNSSISFANKGKVEIMAPNVGEDVTIRILDTLKRLGIDTSRASTIDDEILYLKQILYQEKSVIDNLLVGKSIDEQVIILRQEASKKVGVRDITKCREYNPTGVRSAFDDGNITRYRPDLAEDKAFQKFRQDYVLIHNNTNGSLSDTIEQILNSGGNLISTTNKLRMGMEWGGMSPSADMGTGGASYVFTRIKKATGNYSHGFVWDSDLLRRLDSISYGGDNFGRVTGNHVLENRLSGIAEWKNAARHGSNETIFKNHLSIFDRLKYIVAYGNNERQKILDIFRKHGYTSFPDGRRLEEVVILATR